MLFGKKIAVVIPCYNEETQIGGVLGTMPPEVDYVVLVDDASEDGTVARILQWEGVVDITDSRETLSTRKKGEIPSRLLLIRHSQNRGVGAAIVTGYLWCRENEVDIAAVMAGDGQMDPADLPHVVEPVARGEADYCKGNRLFTGEAWKKIPKIRYLGNSVLSLLTKIASGYWHVADSQTGYTAVNLKMLKLVPWESTYPRYGCPNDYLVKLNVFNARVRDVPVRPVYGIGEKSEMRITTAIPIISWLLWKLFWWRMWHKYVIRDFHPLVFFYLLGFATVPAGFLFGSYLFFYRIFFGPVAGTSALFAAFLLVSGLQSLFFAMWFDMEYNRELR